MEIYLIRHTKPQIENGICYGQSDIPLASSFETEANKLIQLLPSSFDKIYSSPLLRCRQLAQFIAKKEQIAFDNRLLEMNFGDWEMIKWENINKEAQNEWMRDFVNVRTPNGESFIDLDNRVKAFMSDLLQLNKKKIALVSHAGVIRAILCQILEIPLKNAFKLKIDYGGISKINIEISANIQSIGYLNL